MRSEEQATDLSPVSQKPANALNANRQPLIAHPFHLDHYDCFPLHFRAPRIHTRLHRARMHVVAGDGDLLAGFWGMRRLLRDLPLGLPVWLILHLPGMGWLGPKVYNFIARHRYRINRFFGVEICEDGVCKVHG